MNRAITVMGLVQIVCVVVGFFALGIVLKISGYPDGNPLAVWSPVAVFLRTYGLLLLMVPILWVGLAVFSVHRDRGFFQERVALLLGVIVAAGLVGAFLYACVFRFDRLLLILPLK